MLTALLVMLSLGRSAIGAEKRIANSNDLSNFINEVYRGSNYLGTTVIIETDLSLPGATFSKDRSYARFRGVLDGQGYTISNLKISTSTEYAGLFDYSTGLTIKNIVFDSSCSLTSSYKKSFNAYTGGITGNCEGSDGPCTFENIVSMETVTFDGNVSGNTISNSYSYLGGIVGFLGSKNFESTMKNCVNYGPVTFSGGSKYLNIGGLVGSLSTSGTKLVQNCANYGVITNSGSTGGLYLGGISGRSSSSEITNCLSAGKITPGKSGYIGSLTGEGDSTLSINYCYFTSDVGTNTLYNALESSSVPTLTGTPTSASTLNSGLVNNLNSRVTSSNGFKKWVMLHLNGGKFSNLNQDVFAVIVNQIPDPVKNGQIFLYWCTDANLNKKYDPKTTDASKLTDLYALFGVEVTVSFNADGGSVGFTSKKVITNTIYGDFPATTKVGHTFTGWFTEAGDSVTSGTTVKISKDHTLNARWSVNKYTISFVSNGGTACNPITQDYGSSFTLPKPNKTGYTFIYWASDTLLTTEYTTRKIESKNVTLYAKWVPNNYTVSFNTNGGSDTLSSKRVSFNSTYGSLPIPTKEGYSFIGWFAENNNNNIKNEAIVSIPNDHTLYAKWTPNNYTVSFNATGGNVTPSSKRVSFNNTYGDLPIPSKDGFRFVGWIIEENENITDETIVSIPNDHTLYAEWEEIPTKQVEIVFKTKDMSEEDIRGIIKKYTNDEFVIIRKDTDGELMVIVKFTNTENAEEFVRNLNTLNRLNENRIKRIGFIAEGLDESLSMIICPTIFFLSLSL